MNFILSIEIIHESIFTTKDFKKSILKKGIWTTRLRTSTFGHFMALKGTSILSSLKLKPIMKINIKYPTLN
jgi:hypothetical protein